MHILGSWNIKDHGHRDGKVRGMQGQVNALECFLVELKRNFNLVMDSNSRDRIMSRVSDESYVLLLLTALQRAGDSNSHPG